MSDCSICGSDPCSHQCPNSVHYYSPEQERYDDQFYGEDDVRERYASEIADMENEALYWETHDIDEDGNEVEIEPIVPVEIVPIEVAPDLGDNIPF